MSTNTSELLVLVSAFEKGGSEQQLNAIITSLAALDSDCAIKTLCEFVNDPFSPTQLRLAALCACSHLPDEQTIQLFLKELDASSQKHQQLAIHTLGCWKIHKAIPALSRRLRVQHQTVQSKLLAEALARIGTDTALFSIQQWLNDAEKQLLKERLDCLASIPQASLVGVLEVFRGWSEAEVLVDIERAIETLKARIEESMQKRLSPFRLQMEEGLF